MEPVDYLVVGHVVRDLTPGGWRVGGTATYASITASRLGLRVGVVTRAAPDIAPRSEGGAIQVVQLPSVVTTTFENIYSGGHRRQYVRSVAVPIRASDIPAEWRSAPVVHLGPVAQELSPAPADLFPGALLGVTPQGWMRRWDSDGRVSPCRWRDAARVLPMADVTVLSEEDVAGDAHLIEQYAALARMLVVTCGSAGSTVFYQGRRVHVPARPAREVDPTGAGDVFAAAVLTALFQGSDPLGAAEFANCVASFSVEAEGVDGIPTREQLNICSTA